MSRKNNRLEYMSLYHEPKVNILEISKDKKKPQVRKKKNNAKVYNILYNLSVILFFIGAFELFAVVTWNALGGYDMSGIAIIKSIIPGIIALGVGLFLMHIIPDGKGVRK